MTDNERLQSINEMRAMKAYLEKQGAELARNPIDRGEFVVVHWDRQWESSMSQESLDRINLSRMARGQSPIPTVKEWQNRNKQIMPGGTD